MKRISYIILLTLSVLLVSCKKYPELKVYKIDFINETVEKTASTARMTVEYSYPTKLESVNVMLSEKSGLGGAISSAAIITEKTFTAEFADLKSGTKYYYCYEYSNGMSLVKTDVKSFETSSASVPTVITSSVTNITQTSAVGGGNVTSDGGAAVTVRGVCWSTSQNPTISDAHNASGSGTGIYEVNMPALTANTTYYVRAYATNSAGTSYGEQKSFTTLQSGTATVPSVTTSSVSNITQTSATCGGNVTSDGGATVTARGVCWSTSSNPTTSDSHTTNGSGTGTFTSSITGLTANTTYYVRAYATNNKGTSYGEQMSFTTLHSGTVTVPSVTTNSVSNITQTTATCGGNVTSDGGATVTARGVCWSTSPNPTISNSHTTNGTGTGSFTSNITGLTSNTTYYVRAYATNTKGTSYGEQKSFATSQSVTTPTVTTGSVSNITQTTATCGGNVTSDGGANVTTRGVCWSTSQNPTISDAHNASGSGIGSYEVNMPALTANTTYYVRAYATNSAGTSYGSQKSFTTNGSSGGHEYFNLGLPSGLLWATCNIGATNPEDYGDYFAWGETSPKSNYNWSTYQWCNGSATTLTKYCTNSSYGYNGFVDNKTVLEPADDAAHVNWGGDWRMPTSTEMYELKNNCTWTWTTQGGKNGYRVTGSDNNSIFLPAAGFYYESSLGSAGYNGYYWSSSLDAGTPSRAYYSGFYSGYVDMYDNDRYFGRSVRPVCQLQK